MSVGTILPSQSREKNLERKEKKLEEGRDLAVRGPGIACARMPSKNNN
jgi:hypothetical protein